MKGLALQRSRTLVGQASQRPVFSSIPSGSRPSCKPLSSRSVTVSVHAAFSPPPVSITKTNFLSHYKKPIASIYNTVIQELLVQHHFMRYAVNYEYNEVFALGLVSVFEQILESIGEKDRAEIFNAYIRALDEDPETYRRDAAALEKAAAALPPSAKLEPAGDEEVQKILAKLAEKVQAGKLAYNRFFAIGLFRLLEITGAKEPSALEGLVKAVGVKPESVNKDLMLYKNILSKLSVAKELMRDFLEREKKKQAEREAEKAARAEKEAAEAVGEKTTTA